MSNIYNFIIRERVYVLMFVFLLLFNMLNSASRKAGHEERQEKLISLQDRLKEDFSTGQDELKERLQSRPRLALAFSSFSILAFFGFIAGILLCGRAVFNLMKGREILAGRRGGRGIGWEVLDVARVSITALFTAYIVSVLLAIIFAAFNIKGIDDHMAMMIDTTVVDSIILLTVFFFVWAKYKEKVISLGLGLSHWRKDIATGLFGYLAILPVVVGILLSVVWAAGLFKYEPPPQPVMDLLISEERGHLLFYGMIFVALLGPVCEEIFFRGFAYTALRNRFGMRPAIILTSAVFGALHGNIIAFFPVAVLGWLLAYLYEKTGSLIPSITVHIIHNSVLVSLIFLFKELSV